MVFSCRSGTKETRWVSTGSYMKNARRIGRVREWVRIFEILIFLSMLLLELGKWSCNLHAPNIWFCCHSTLEWRWQYWLEKREQRRRTAEMTRYQSIGGLIRRLHSKGKATLIPKGRAADRPSLHNRWPNYWSSLHCGSRSNIIGYYFDFRVEDPIR